MAYFLEAGKLGDAQAQLTLGKAYLKGEGRYNPRLRASSGCLQLPRRRRLMRNLNWRAITNVKEMMQRPRSS